LAAFDLDGTLLNSQNAMSDGNGEALHWLAARGVVVVAATARPYESAMRHFAPRGLVAAAVVCAGADVRDTRGTVIRQSPLPGEFVEFVAALSDRADWTATLATAEMTFRREPTTPEWAATPRPGLRFVESFSGMALPGILTALLQPPADDPHIAELLAWEGRVGFHQAFSFDGTELITATAPGADKGHGLAALCAALGIDPADAVAFGDSGVDLPMFGVAGLAVAMANGDEAVRAAAGMVAGHNDDDGVAAAVRKIWG